MRVAVIGVGGIGGYFGAALAKAGVDVTFVARGETLVALRTHGLTVHRPEGELRFAKVQTASRPTEVGGADLWLVAVKAWQVAEVAQSLLGALDTDSMVLPLQNGIEASDQLAAVLGEGPVLNGVARILSLIEAPGVIRHIGTPPWIALGERSGPPTERVERIAMLLRDAGVKVATPDDIRVALWEKFLFVSSWGALGAVCRAPVGPIRTLPATRAMLEAAMREVDSMARARGIALPEDAVAKSMSFIDALPAEGTTSLQRDLIAGRPSELEAWCGAAVRAGQAEGIDTRVHGFCYAALLPQELAARSAL